jgi:hypothetical protein
MSKPKNTLLKPIYHASKAVRRLKDNCMTLCSPDTLYLGQTRARNYMYEGMLNTLMAKKNKTKISIGPNDPIFSRKDTIELHNYNFGNHTLIVNGYKGKLRDITAASIVDDCERGIKTSYFNNGKDVGVAESDESVSVPAQEYKNDKRNVLRIA